MTIISKPPTENYRRNWEIIFGSGRKERIKKLAKQIGCPLAVAEQLIDNSLSYGTISVKWDKKKKKYVVGEWEENERKKSKSPKKADSKRVA